VVFPDEELLQSTAETSAEQLQAATWSQRQT